MLAFGVAAQAHAGTLDFTGTLAIQLMTIPPVEIPGVGAAIVNGSGAAGHLSALALAGGTFMTTGFSSATTPPHFGVFAGIHLTASNGAGSFGGGPLGGVMPLAGIAKLCLAAPCTQPPPANLNVPLDVVGVGGSIAAGGALNVTVVGAPWTTATVAVGTVTRMG
jgi:hypothetical protein